MKYDEKAFRRGLLNYRTRSAVIGAAIETPEVFFDAAIKLLNERNDTLRWCAIRILGEIGDERAVEPLQELIAAKRNVVEARDALRAIAGDNGAGAAQNDLGSDDEDDSMTDEELLSAALRDIPAEISGSAPYFAVNVALSDGRSQEVYVDFSRVDPDGRPIVYLCTACGAVDQAKFEWALKLNMIIPYGAIGIAKVEDDDCFAMVNTYLRETANPREIGFSVKTLASEGDSIEKALCRQG